MLGTGWQELLMLGVIIVVPHYAGVLPIIARGMRVLRGEIPPDTPITKGDAEVACRLLGVSASAPWEEIERAYRRKARKHHPDHGGDEDAMRALNEAYSQLKRLRGR
jgi:DnaJ-domain-containing protein 1